jgi:hypothetical protein
MSDDFEEVVRARFEMHEAFMLGSDEGLAAWLYGFLSAFDPADHEYIDDPGGARDQYDAALAMLRRLAALDELDGVLDVGLPEPPMSPLWWATRRAISYGGWHAEASAVALAETRREAGK